MITLFIPLGSRTQLANVRYYWIVAGVKQSPQATGISQPDANFPFFIFNVTPPFAADELIAYDATDIRNWNVGAYKIGSLGGAIPANITLTVPLSPGTLLANVTYEWIVGNSAQGPLTDGINQPDNSIPMFELNIVPPAGAQELIVWDVTNINNWNVGGFRTAILTQFAAPTTTTAFPFPTTTFKSVYESIIRRMGYNPRGDRVKEDVGKNVLHHINERIGYAWALWDWPQTKLIEWRAFRTVYNATFNWNIGDEFYYFGDGITVPARNVDPPSVGPNAGYYVTLLPAPAGSPPTNTTLFAPETLSDFYISYTQTGENPIGDLLDVYEHNPRERTRRTRVLTSYPSSKGIDVRHVHQDIVWIRYGVPTPQFTLRPFLVGNINPGQSYYDPVTGNCFIYRGSVSTMVGDILIPFPTFLAGYVRSAAFYDCLLETDNQDQIRLAIAHASMQSAEEYLVREIDRLLAQGQKLYYPAFPKRNAHYGRHIGVAVGAIPTEGVPDFT